MSYMLIYIASVVQKLKPKTSLKTTIVTYADIKGLGLKNGTNIYKLFRTNDQMPRQKEKARSVSSLSYSWFW